MSDWFLHPQPRPDAAVRLFCVPAAGAGPASLHDWPVNLPSFVDMVGVRLPGRELRLAEEPMTSMTELLDRLVVAIDPWLDRPVALYGHSLGASVAYELARWLHEHRPDSRPVLLAVAAGRAPHVAPQVPLYQMADDELLLELERMGGLPDEARQFPELLELMLPTIRADLTLADTYTRAADGLLDCPLVAYSGADDKELDATAMEPWREHTTGRFFGRTLPGGHMFPSTAGTEMLDQLAQLLRFCA